MPKIKKKYADKDDLERLYIQWKKIRGLHSRDEWSAGVIRAATAAEIAANIVIRHQLSESNLEKEFIDSLLRWSNGIQGKIERLLTKLPNTYSKEDLKSARQLVFEINNERNEIVHSGYFCSEKKSTKIINKSRDFVILLLKNIHPEVAEKITPVGAD